MYVKPRLSRCDSLSRTADQYKQLNAQLVFMVKELNVMLYADIGFRDENQAHRKVGGNATIILFSEKLGHQEYLNEIAQKYQVSIIALGGQPSVINTEYFVDELKKAGVNLQRSFYLFSVVDFDTSGWIIRDAFLNNLNFYGIKNTRIIDLVNPDELSKDEIMISRYRIPVPVSMKKKNTDWVNEVAKRGYQNQKFMTEESILFGLEAESISSKRLTATLEKSMVPLIGKSEDLLKKYELKNIVKAIEKLILKKVA